MSDNPYAAPRHFEPIREPSRVYRTAVEGTLVGFIALLTCVLPPLSFLLASYGVGVSLRERKAGRLYANFALCLNGGLLVLSLAVMAYAYRCVSELYAQ
ncbi:MAG: hypothetical protein KGM43_14005 [Planctomycetota bacterium]|nr:hypothetical protein [Planctomycetota bacterium]